MDPQAVGRELVASTLLLNQSEGGGEGPLGLARVTTPRCTEAGAGLLPTPPALAPQTFLSPTLR